MAECRQEPLRSPIRIGLNTPVRDFPDRLFTALKGYLDKEDGTGRRDWRALVQKLSLDPDSVARVQNAQDKTKTALFNWQENESDNERNGRALVRILYDLGRNDAATEVQRFLGQKYTPDSWEYEDILEAARMGCIGSLEKLIGDRKVSLTALVAQFESRRALALPA